MGVVVGGGVVSHSIIFIPGMYVFGRHVFYRLRARRVDGDVGGTCLPKCFIFHPTAQYPPLGWTLSVVADANDSRRALARSKAAVEWGGGRGHLKFSGREPQVFPQSRRCAPIVRCAICFFCMRGRCGKRLLPLKLVPYVDRAVSLLNLLNGVHTTPS